MQVDLKKHYKNSKKMAWEIVHKSFLDRLGISFKELQSCISFEEDFRPVVLKKTKKVFRLCEPNSIGSHSLN